MLLELFGRFKRPRQRSEKRETFASRIEENDGLQHGPENNIPESQENNNPGGFFANASGFVVNKPTMTDIHSPQFTQNVVNNINTGTAAFEHLLPYICSEAAVDSSARHPPPRCHPGTRKSIGNKLEDWLDNPKREQNMIWLSGPAGTGKSAVAQTFAEFCLERGRLGAAFFSSRPNNRDDPNTIIPTIAYQLAVYLPEYGSLLTSRIAHDPTILQKTPRTQLRILVIEPFSILQMRGHHVIREPLLILLDGLDECHGVDPQCELVEMIGDVVRLKKGLPLLWLICSRPEPHLKYLFRRPDFRIECDRIELLIDAETRDDVDRYLYDGFRDIREKLWDVTPASWPSDAHLLEVSKITQGLFVFASIILKYVGDLENANPTARLAAFLAWVKNTGRAFTSNPLEALDLFYSQILAEIPDNVLSITKRILTYSFSWTNPEAMKLISSAQALCNFLCIDQSTFYNALRKLHSVVDVPTPEDAAQIPLRFYHASFAEYLCDPTRCGKFAIDPVKARADLVQSCIFWHKIDLNLRHDNDGPFDARHDHGLLPDLKWVSEDTSKDISSRVAQFSEFNCWEFLLSHAVDQEVLISPRRDKCFQYIKMEHGYFLYVAYWLCCQDDSKSFLRTKPRNNLELHLLNSIRTETTQSGRLEHATFERAGCSQFVPTNDPRTQKGNSYFFFGRDDSTYLFWYSCSEGPRPTILGRVHFLSTEPPSAHPLDCVVTSIDFNFDGTKCEWGIRECR